MGMLKYLVTIAVSLLMLQPETQVGSYGIYFYTVTKETYSWGKQVIQGTVLYRDGDMICMRYCLENISQHAIRLVRGVDVQLEDVFRRTKRVPDCPTHSSREVIYSRKR
jgi:hypothetical protein